jgi:uncharacterized protein YneF (UPF0154 family)
MDWGLFFLCLFILIAGIAIGIFLARFVVKKEFEKNPPISEDMIAAMLKSMGQAPSQKRVNQIVKQMKEANKKKKK